MIAPLVLEIEDWPTVDRMAWTAACKPRVRLTPGGRAGHMKSKSQRVIARAYGQFLAVCRTAGRSWELDRPCLLIDQIAVGQFLEVLERRVKSVTLACMIFRLYRIACLLRPEANWEWLREIWLERRDQMRRRSLTHRLVTTDRLYRLGVDLMRGVELNTRLNCRWRAGRYRNGLLIALLALAPIRLANLHQLAIDRTLVRQEDEWWIVLPASETKSGRPDEKPLGAELSHYIDCWIEVWRPAFKPDCDTLWPSPRGGVLAYTYIGTLITKTTRKHLGVAVNPHLFRSCMVETLATFAPELIGIASPMLQHNDERTSDKYYKRGNAQQAFMRFQRFIEGLEK